MLKQPLFENWRVRAIGDLSEVPSALRDAIVPAKVPICVHTALLHAGKIPDPYVGTNSDQLQWIGRSDWQYRCTFDADPRLFDHERIDLCVDGLDTVATIELNGTPIGQTQNMHRRYRFALEREHSAGGLQPACDRESQDTGGLKSARPSGAVLRRGRNELVITFASPVKYALACRQMTLEQLTTPPVFQCANRFGAK
jgi:beta-mannosidase